MRGNDTLTAWIDEMFQEEMLHPGRSVTARMLAEIRAAGTDPQAGWLTGHVRDIGYGAVAYLPLPAPPPLLPVGTSWNTLRAIMALHGGAYIRKG